MKTNKFISKIKSFFNPDVNTLNGEKTFYISVIDGVINAKSGGDLKLQLERVQSYKFSEKQRYTFLIGLLQGALMQFKRDVSVEKLEGFFKKI